MYCNECNKTDAIEKKKWEHPSFALKISSYYLKWLSYEESGFLLFRTVYCEFQSVCQVSINSSIIFRLATQKTNYFSFR